MTILRISLVLAAVIGVCAGKTRADTFEAKGVKINYWTEGKGEPVILVHGLYSNGFINWTLVGVQKELAKDHKVIVLDLPGHGLSGRPADKDAYGVQLADDIALLMDHLKIKKAHVVGYSLGGMITMKFMSKHPTRVLSGTVCGMGWFQEGSDSQKLMGKLPAGGLAPPKEFFETVGTLALTEQEVKKIDLPVKIIIGEKDLLKYLYVTPLQKVRKDWPVVEIAKGDHITCIVQPQFREEIGAWVRKNSK